MNNIYIDEAQKRIYIDYSTRAIFQSCKDKARLGNVIGWRTKEKTERDFPLDFGHAFHAACAAFYDHAAGGFFDNNLWHKFPEGAKPSGTRIAQTAFVQDLKNQGSIMKIEIDTSQSRTIERGVALVEAYIERWRNEPYENILDAQGRPLTEIYFEIPIARWGEWTLYYCGTIDRIMMDIMVKRPVIFETKTTGKPLPVFIEERKPNHQVTGYFNIAWHLMAENFPELPEIREAVWDCIFVSKRAPDIQKSLKERFFMWGIDIKADFVRQRTQRSKTDVINFMIDLEADAIDFAKHLMSQQTTWPKAGGFACHVYGGCAFRGYCSTNDAPEILSTYFEVKQWNPRKKLRELQ